MKLTTLLVLAVAGASLVACGDSSPADACRNQAAVQCKKMWTCDAPVKLGDDESS